MKCAKIVGPKKIVTDEISNPQSVNGEVVIEVKKAGICGSDIHYWEAGMPEGLVMGHELCGVVIDPGNREDLKPGDRVTSLPISPCGKCSSCQEGNAQSCPQTWTYALGLSLDYPGAYAKQTKFRSDMVIKVPDNISDNEVAMVEPSAVALHGINIANIKKGDHVLVIGAGIIGDLTAIFAKIKGASYVAISETNIKRGEKAVNLGCADEFFNAKDADFLQKVMAQNPHGFDVVIDCCGNEPAVTSAILTTKPNGTLVLAGVSLNNLSLPIALIVTKELKVYGTIAYTKEEFEECINLMAEKKLDTTKLVDDIVPIEDTQASFERLTSGQDDAIKILIDPQL